MAGNTPKHVDANELKAGQRWAIQPDGQIPVNFVNVENSPHTYLVSPLSPESLPMVKRSMMVHYDEAISRKASHVEFTGHLLIGESRFEVKGSFFLHSGQGTIEILS